MDVKEMNSTVWSFFLARTVYMGLYMGIKSDTLAYVSDWFRAETTMLTDVLG